MIKDTRGFTLIELLVVIAIIGLLSSVVLAALSTARKKASDAAIQANLKTIQIQAQIYYDDHSYYAPLSASPRAGCSGNVFNGRTITAALAAARTQTIGGFVWCSISSSGKKYVVVAELASTPSKYWCTDSSSISTITTAGAWSYLSSACK